MVVQISLNKFGVVKFRVIKLLEPTVLKTVFFFSLVDPYRDHDADVTTFFMVFVQNMANAGSDP